MSRQQLTERQLADALYAAWDDGNAVGLDGWIGPERGEEPDEHAIRVRDQYVSKAVADLTGSAS